MKFNIISYINIQFPLYRNEKPFPKSDLLHKNGKQAFLAKQAVLSTKFACFSWLSERGCFLARNYETQATKNHNLEMWFWHCEKPH